MTSRHLDTSALTRMSIKSFNPTNSSSFSVSESDTINPFRAEASVHRVDN